MAKREHPELINGDLPATKLKKVKTSHSTSDGEPIAKRSKEEKKAKRVKEENAVEATNDDDDRSKAERKALRKAKKAALKAAKSSPDDSTYGSGATSANVSTPEPIIEGSSAEFAYTEHEEIAKLPKAEIDAFVSENALSTEDPLKQSRRPIISFDYLPLRNDALRAPFKAFSKPTPIQAACWPHLFAGRDVIGVAETGSGKTLAFALPCVQHIASLSKKQRTGIKACVVSPTRELAMQIHSQFLLLTEPAGLKTSIESRRTITTEPLKYIICIFK